MKMAKFDSSSPLLLMMVLVCACTMFRCVVQVTSLSSSSSSGHDGPSSCAEVRHIYVAKRLGTSDMVPDVSVSGAELQICKSTSSCCTKEMEERFQSAVSGEFANIMHSASSHLENLFANNVAKFQESFLEMVRTSENKTNILFAEVYQKIAGQAQGLVDKLYGGLEDFLLGKDVDLESAVASPVTCFFDGLFPLVYHHTINPKLKDFDDDYKECLHETRSEVKPFGDIPQHVASSVSRSFQAARTFLHSLQLGIEVLNGTDHQEIGVECQRALMRLLYCPQCRRLVSAKSCNGYCMNVVRGCLANMAEIDQPWNDYVLALDRLTNSMRAGLVLDDVTSGLDTKITDAIMYAMENGPELSKKVKKACGHPRRTAREVPMSSGSSSVGPSSSDAIVDTVAALPIAGTIASVHSPSSSSPLNPSLVVQLQTFMRRVVHSKNFYASLPDTLCSGSDDSLAVRTESNCWNGESLGEYTKTIAGNGISAQKYNPEIKMLYGKDEKISLLIDKLKKMRQILHARAMSLPEADSMIVNDGSGSGYGGRNGDYGDDEDYYASGGSGYNEEQDFEEEESETEYDRNHDHDQPAVPRSDPDLVFTGGDEKQQPPSHNTNVRKSKKQSAVDQAEPTQPSRESVSKASLSSSRPSFLLLLLLLTTTTTTSTLFLLCALRSPWPNV